VVASHYPIHASLDRFGLLTSALQRLLGLDQTFSALLCGDCNISKLSFLRRPFAFQQKLFLRLFFLKLLLLIVLFKGFIKSFCCTLPHGKVAEMIMKYFDVTYKVAKHYEAILKDKQLRQIKAWYEIKKGDGPVSVESEAVLRKILDKGKVLKKVLDKKNRSLAP
jgi:hypothetical protein